MFSIAALATERYLTVTSTYRRTCSRSRTVAISIGIWIFSIAVSFIYFATGFYTFVFVFANTTVIATLLIITFAYIRIYQSLHVHVEHGGTTRSNRIKEQRLKYEKKATRSFFFVIFVFICCNVSSCVMVYVILLCDVCTCDVIHWLRDFQFLMALVNCSANQFLYAWRMPTFIRAFKVLLTFKSARVGSGQLTSITDRTQSGTEGISVEQRVRCSAVWSYLNSFFHTVKLRPGQTGFSTYRQFYNNVTLERIYFPWWMRWKGVIIWKQLSIDVQCPFTQKHHSQFQRILEDTMHQWYPLYKCYNCKAWPTELNGYYSQSREI